MLIFAQLLNWQTTPLLDKVRWHVSRSQVHSVYVDSVYKCEGEEREGRAADSHEENRESRKKRRVQRVQGEPWHGETKENQKEWVVWGGGRHWILKKL